MKIESNPRKFFAFMIITYSALIFIVIQVLSWSLYYAFKKSGTELTDSLAKKNLDTIVTTIQKDFDSLNLYCQQLFNNNDVIALMYGDLSDQSQLNSITIRLAKDSSIFPYIYSIYVYNKRENYYYCSNQTYSDSSASFFDKDIEKIIKEPGTEGNNPILRKIPDPSGSSKLLDVYSFILYDNYGNKALSDAVLVLNITVDPVTDLLKSLKYPDYSSYLILSRDGTIVGSSAKEDFFKNIREDRYLNRIAGNITRSGSFIYKKGNSLMFARYDYYPALDWTFVNVTPYDILFKNVKNIGNTTLVINILVLILSILVSLILSKSINNPIRNLINKTTSFEKIKKDNYLSIRNDILLNILQNGVIIDNSVNNFKEFDIKLDLMKDFVLVHVRIDNSSGFYETYSSNDRKLMLFSVGNILCEILSQYFTSEAVISDRDFLDILINVEKDTSDEILTSFIQLFSKAQEEVSAFLKFSVSLTISNRLSNPLNIPDEYCKVIENSDYRLVKGHSSIILSSEIPLFEKLFVYPSSNERQLFDMLTLGKISSAFDKYNEMVQFAARYSYNDIIRFFLQLALSFNSFINKLNSTANTEIAFELNRFVIFLNKAETIEDINARFQLLFEEICKALEPEKDDRNNELISSISDFIEKNYHDPNLSLNAVADYLDMSPAYLGRLYKKLTGLSILDFINDLRLKKAMEKLSGSSEKIEDICDNIGFPNVKYFYMFFRKHTGITPGEFRNRSSRA